MCRALVLGSCIQTKEVALARCSALTAGDFFLSRQEKVTKKKATPAPRSAAPTSQRYSSSRAPQGYFFTMLRIVQGAAAQLGPVALKQCSPTSPGLPALLGAPQGNGVGVLPPRTETAIGSAHALCVVEQRRAQRKKGEDCLSPVGASSAAPVATEQRREPGEAGRRGGRAFFLGTSSWQDKKKYPAIKAEHSASSPKTSCITSTVQGLKSNAIALSPSLGVRSRPI